jgi:hypothetical protein
METEFIGCGCSDSKGCRPNPTSCSWLAKDDVLGLGVCTNCQSYAREFEQHQKELMSALAPQRDKVKTAHRT